MAQLDMRLNPKLRMADDAIPVDSSGKSVDEVLESMLAVCRTILTNGSQKS